MNNTLRMLALLTLLALPVVVSAEDDDELGVTMTVVDDQENADEAQFFNEIELPDVVPEQAQSNAQSGVETANEAREQGREFGREQAEEGHSHRNDGNRGRPPVDPPAP